MVESRKEAQQLSRFHGNALNRNQPSLSADQYLRSGIVSGVVQCLSQIRTRSEKSFPNSFCEENLTRSTRSPTNSPLSLCCWEKHSLLRECDRPRWLMRNSKIDLECKNIYRHLSRSCWWGASLLVWRTSTVPWRHWGKLGGRIILHWLLLAGSCPRWRWLTGSRRTWSTTRRTRSTGGRRRSTPGSSFSGHSLVISCQ